MSKRVLRRLKNYKLVSIATVIEKRKKVKNSKVAKAAEHVEQYAKGAVAVYNFLNPVYWVKKASFKMYGLFFNKIMVIIINIIGNETANVYSKNLFAADDLNKEIEEIEKMLGDGNK